MTIGPSGARGTHGNLGSGICLTDADLCDDLFFFYNRISNRNTSLIVGLAMGFPGSWTRSVVDGNAPNWTGGFVNVVINI
jgi:hypothetical protein